MINVAWNIMKFNEFCYIWQMYFLIFLSCETFGELLILKQELVRSLDILLKILGNFWRCLVKFDIVYWIDSIIVLFC